MKRNGSERNNPLFTIEDMDAALESDDFDLVRRALLQRTGDQESYEHPVELIRRFGKHPDAEIRNACLIGISKVLNLHGRFDATLAAELIDLGLRDESDTVHGNAMSALEDMEEQRGFPPAGYEHLLDYLREDGWEDEEDPETDNK